MKQTAILDFVLCLVEIIWNQKSWYRSYNSERRIILTWLSTIKYSTLSTLHLWKFSNDSWDSMLLFSDFILYVMWELFIYYLFFKLLLCTEVIKGCIMSSREQTKLSVKLNRKIKDSDSRHLNVKRNDWMML